MLYVIGTSEFDFVAIKSNTLASVGQPPHA